MNTINWEVLTWKHLSLADDEEVISLSHAKVYVFSDSVLCLRKVNQNPTSNNVWEQQLGLFKESPQYRTLDTIDGEPMEFEWNIFPGFTTLQLVQEVQKFMNKMPIHQHLKDELSSCRCSMTSYGDLKTMNGNAMTTPQLCLDLHKDSQQDVGHSSDLDQNQSGVLLAMKDHKNGTGLLN